MLKRCSACFSEKLLSEFYADSNLRNKTGRQSRCKDCCKKQAAAYWAAHPEKKVASGKRYRNSTKDKQRERSARRRNEDPDYWREYAKNYRAQWRAKNPEQESATQKRYRERNPAVVAERMAQYVHAKRRPLAWAERDKMQVVYAKSKEWRMEVDHIVPLRSKLVSGLHVWWNLQLLERPENRRKKNVHWPDMP